MITNRIKQSIKHASDPALEEFANMAADAFARAAVQKGDTTFDHDAVYGERLGALKRERQRLNASPRPHD